VLVKDINPIPLESSRPDQLVDVNGTLFFTADDGTTGIELWKSNGTAAGTTLVRDISSAFGGSVPTELTAVGTTLFFVATDDDHGTELWKSNGTTAGTVMVKDIVLGQGGSSPSLLTKVGGVLFFTAFDDDGLELWKSDGTPGETVQVRDILTGPDSSAPFRAVRRGRRALLRRPRPGRQRHGALEERRDARRHHAREGHQPGVADSFPDSFARVGTNVYFAATDAVHGRELWRTDGTPGGTALEADIFEGRESSDPIDLVNVNGKLVFVATKASVGAEPWVLGTCGNGTVEAGDGLRAEWLRDAVLLDACTFEPPSLPLSGGGGRASFPRSAPAPGVCPSNPLAPPGTACNLGTGTCNAQGACVTTTTTTNTLVPTTTSTTSSTTSPLTAPTTSTTTATAASTSTGVTSSSTSSSLAISTTTAAGLPPVNLDDASRSCAATAARIPSRRATRLPPARRRRAAWIVPSCARASRCAMPETLRRLSDRRDVRRGGALHRPAEARDGRRAVRCARSVRATPASSATAPRSNVRASTKTSACGCVTLVQKKKLVVAACSATQARRPSRTARPAARETVSWPWRGVRARWVARTAGQSVIDLVRKPLKAKEARDDADAQAEAPPERHR
jgi:ELWxxDGT repeat protein